MHTAYLEAKRSIDDRSINRAVWDRMVEIAARVPGDQLRIAEIGAGTGTMIDRMRDWGFFAAVDTRRITYDGWEPNPDTAEVLERRVSRAREFASARVHTEDIQAATGPFDLVIAHAVVDLFTPETTVGLAERLLSEDGALYASIVFDGVTVFEPVVDAALDRAILDRYHHSMTQGFGRSQVYRLWQAGFSVTATGGSSWIIPPSRQGPDEDERQLITTVLDMMRESIEPDGVVTRPALDQWVQTRRKQLTAGELFFAAHQIDFLVQR